MNSPFHFIIIIIILFDVVLKLKKSLHFLSLLKKIRVIDMNNP